MVDKLLWMDLETTGLNPSFDRILEVAMVITDKSLHQLDDASWIVLQPGWSKGHIPEHIFSPRALEMHKANGLLERLVDDAAYNRQWLPEIEQAILGRLAHFGMEQDIVMAGNTVDFDRSFLRVHMPELFRRTHYRTFNVTTLKLMFQMVAGEEAPKLESQHRALGDIQNSIDEYAWYLTHLEISKPLKSK